MKSTHLHIRLRVASNEEYSFAHVISGFGAMFR